MKNLVNYVLVALVAFLLGVFLAPSGRFTKAVKSKMKNNRFAAQKLYQKWDTGSLSFYDGGSFDDFRSKNERFAIYFWATWCPHCENIKDTIQELDISKLQLIGMTFDRDKDVFEQYRSETPYFWHDLVKTSGGNWDFVERAEQYKIPLIPSVWIIERGKVKKVFVGEAGIKKLPAYLEKL